MFLVLKDLSCKLSWLLLIWTVNVTCPCYLCKDLNDEHQHTSIKFLHFLQTEWMKGFFEIFIFERMDYGVCGFVTTLLFILEPVLFKSPPIPPPQYKTKLLCSKKHWVSAF